MAADAILGDTAAKCDGGRPAVAARDLHRPAGRRGRAHARVSARDAGIERPRRRPSDGSAVAGASYHGRDAPGTTRLVVDEDRGVIAGATFTGPEVAELLHAATVAVVGEVPLERLARDPVVPHAQRGLAAAAGEVRAVAEGRRPALAGRRHPSYGLTVIVHPFRRSWRPALVAVAVRFPTFVKVIAVELSDVRPASSSSRTRLPPSLIFAFLTGRCGALPVFFGAVTLNLKVVLTPDLAVVVASRVHRSFELPASQRMPP